MLLHILIAVPGKYHEIFVRFSRQCNRSQEDRITRVEATLGIWITDNSKVVNELRYGGDSAGLSFLNP